MGSTENQLKRGMTSAGVGNVASASVVPDRHSTSANGTRPESTGEVRSSDGGYDESIIHKTILVGDSGVGKTSLLVQFDQKKFQPGSFAATVGIGFTNKVVTVEEAKVKLQIWDTAGQERFRSITHAYYRDAHALLLLYDVMNKTSFDNISMGSPDQFIIFTGASDDAVTDCVSKFVTPDAHRLETAWLAEINEYAQDDVVIMLIGNKADADANGERAVKKEEGISVAKDYGVTFMETSAKTGQNVEHAFMSVARDLKLKKLRRRTQESLQLASHDFNQQPEQGSKQPTSGSTAWGCC